MDKQVALYPEHFAGMDIQAIKDYVRGKICYDCSGLIHMLFGAPDMNSASFIGDCVDVSPDLVARVAGSVLYKTSHIGLDVGYVYCINIPTEGQTIRFMKILEYDWQLSGRWEKYFDYTGADSR